MSLGVPVAAALYFMQSADLEASISMPTFGLILLVSTISGWQHRRLQARVEALTKLVSEIGYPGEA